MPSRSRKSSSETAFSGSRLPDKPRPRSCGGFTLLEVLVALAILGIGLGVIFQGLGFGLRLRGEAAENVRLAVVAERVLGGLPLRRTAPAKPEEGEEEGVRWRLETREAHAGLVPPEGPPERRGAGMVEVLLTVTAPSGRSWELLTLLPPARQDALP